MVQWGGMFPANRFEVEGDKQLLWAIYKHHLFYRLNEIYARCNENELSMVLEGKLTWFKARRKTQLHKQCFFAQSWWSRRLCGGLLVVHILSYHRQQIRKKACARTLKVPGISASYIMAVSVLNLSKNKNDILIHTCVTLYYRTVHITFYYHTSNRLATHILEKNTI